ncbi:adenosylmethionine decarboxylase [Chitinispirillales bacterium ANBcel5]|uniref:adenosylmethionine decarboxylase n=1 Tax=Cellulosispirillum alkaliphilum TaxID=3039283 RepID=UPI002A54F54B|nr:adenosylmethionine decarboxylase [Chitinispirillales bacterium ANBcel5]
MINRCRGRKIKLQGFNNLTKSLSFNIYDICHAKSKSSQIDYLEYIDEEYNSEKLRSILEEVTNIIQAKIVNISTQDYDPRGASVTILINEGHHPREEGDVVAHLDKSHIAAHTYPENNTENGIATFRVDIDVSTCGMISPLKALDFLIDSFDSDIVLMDYRVRGFTRDVRGKKIYIDHDITSIQDYISDEILDNYTAYDINVVSDNIFHTKMKLKNLKLESYLFGSEYDKFSKTEKKRVKALLKKEMQEIFECRNIFGQEV